MKKILALTLSVLMIFALLAGCGGKADKLSDEEMIVGRWEMTMNVGKLFTAAFEQMGVDVGSNKKAELIVYFDFTADGTYAVSVDEASAEKATESIVEIAKDLFRSLYPEETLEQMAAQEGMDVEEMMDAMAAEVAGEMDMSDMNSTGDYKIENGKLYFDGDADEGFTYKLSAKKLELTGVDISEMESDGEDTISMMLEYMFPMVMKKVS